ncbi:MAG: hypothetical protein ACK56B_16280 [Dolichospermum sp.]
MEDNECDRRSCSAIAQNPLFCASLTVVNCDLMGKRSLKIHYLVLP